MKKAARLLAVLFCIPLFCSFFMIPKESGKKKERIVSTAGFAVSVEEETGKFTYDPEEVLPLIMVRMVSGEQQEILYEAAAVICRTNLVYAWEQEDRPTELSLDKTGLSACSRHVYRNLAQASDLENAAYRTMGIVLTYEGEVIPAPFFYMSAGSTRSSREVYGDRRFPYLQTVDCSNDMYRKDFLKQYFYRKEEFYEQLSQITGWQSVCNLADMELNKEETGYVHSIFCIKEQQTMPAEEFCKAFGFCSPCFDWEERESRIMIRTKGIGHGLGFDVCFGADLARQGMDYQKILEYFYNGTKLDKRYNINENLSGR